MFPAETTLAQDGSLVSSDICPFHFRESDKSTLSVNFKNGQAFRLASCLKNKGITYSNREFSTQAIIEMVPDLILSPDLFGPRTIWAPSNLGPEQFGPQEF